MAQTMVIKRVSYGVDSTPKADREYRLTTGGPVGSVSEWKKFAKEQEVTKLVIIEKDGSERTEEI